MAHKGGPGTPRNVGESNPRCKLTERQVKRIRLATAGVMELAEAYGVTPPTISNIRNRKIWRHL